jgi:hypothetical protein
LAVHLVVDASEVNFINVVESKEQVVSSSFSARVWRLIKSAFTAPVIEVGGSTDIRLDRRLVKALNCKGKEAKAFLIRSKEDLLNLVETNIIEDKDVLVLVFERGGGGG